MAERQAQQEPASTEEPYQRPLRPNRGKNPNARWLVDEVYEKPAKRRKNVPKPPKPEEEITEGEVDCRCLGEVSDNRPMAECEKCKCWQHIVCEFGVEDESALPKPHYYCGKCRTKEAEKRGPPEVLPLANVPSELHDYVDEVRRSVAKVFTDIIASEPLAVAIERALFDEYAESFGDATSDVGAAYRERFRTLSFNLKDPNNGKLRRDLAEGRIVPQKFVKMTSEELRNPELKAEVATTQSENLRDTIIKEPTPPREKILVNAAEVNEEPTYQELKEENAENEQVLEKAMQEPLGPPQDSTWTGELALADNTISVPNARGYHLAGSHEWPTRLVVDGLVLAERGYAYVEARKEDGARVAVLAIVSDDSDELYTYMHARDRLGSLDFDAATAYLVPYDGKESVPFLDDQIEFLDHLAADKKVLLAVYIK